MSMTSRATLTRTFILTVVFGFVLAAGYTVYEGHSQNLPLVLGGVVFALLNLGLLAKIVANLVPLDYNPVESSQAPQSGRKAWQVALLFVLKLLVLGLGFYLVFNVFEGDPLAFLLGYGSLILALIGGGLWAQLAPPASHSH